MKFKPLAILLYFLFGLYLINNSLGFFKAPDFLGDFDYWIILISGFMLIVASVIILTSSKSGKTSSG